METRIKKCEVCSRSIGPDFYIVKLAQAWVDYGAVNRHAGMRQYFQGHDALADLFSPDQTFEKVVQGNDANKWPEITICQKCFVENPVLALIWEKMEKESPDA